MLNVTAKSGSVIWGKRQRANSEEDTKQASSIQPSVHSVEVITVSC